MLRGDSAMVKKKRAYLFLGAGLLLFLIWALTSFPDHHVLVENVDQNIRTSVDDLQSHQTNHNVEASNINDLITCRRRVQGKPWFSKSEQVKHSTHLIFYGKPIMQALKHICVERGWRMTMILNSSVAAAGVKQLTRITSEPGVFAIVYTTSRTFHQHVIQQLANSTHALVSAIRFAFKITGAKKGQLETFRSFFSLHGCDLRTKALVPLSFLLDDPIECTEFFKHADAHPELWWVLKPSQGYGGKGITVHTNMSYLYKKFALCQSKEQFIVQQYISNLLLLEGRKFDVRALLVIAGTTPYMLFYHEGYLRVSVEMFDAKGGRGAHLTNSHIQTLSRNYSVDKHFWSFDRFQRYLDVHYPSNQNFVSDNLVPFIKKVAIFILQAGLSVFERNPSSFQVLGLDFMITNDLHIWFVEANNYPLWPKVSSSKVSSFVDELMDTMGKDMFDLLFKIREDPEYFIGMMPGGHFNSMQLIWSEAIANCSLDPPYNPCSEF